MSMQSEPEDFQQLRRLLALKRHEQPPPGYFHNFSSEVVARIRAGESLATETGASRSFLEFAWLHRLWDALETRPALAGAFGAAVCGFLTAGFLLSDNSGVGPTPPVGVLMPETSQISAVQVATPSATAFLNQIPGMALSSTGTLEAVQVRPSLFQQPTARLVNFTLPGGN